MHTRNRNIHHCCYFMTAAIALTATCMSSAQVTIATQQFHTNVDAYSARYTTPKYRFGYPYVYRTGSWNPYWYSTSPYPSSLYVDTQTLIQLAERVDPQLLSDQDDSSDSEPVTTTPQPQSPLPMRAADALASRNYEDAAMLYQRLAESTSTPPRERASALRDAALALAGAGDFERASALLTKAYDTDISLAQRPLGSARVGSRTELVRIATQAQRFARSNQSPDAWQLAGVLLVASGETDSAITAFKNAQRTP